MKFGTETGSIINHALSTTGGHEIVVGTPATLSYWSDRDGATVIDIDTKRNIVTVQVDSRTRVDDNGMSEMQTYTYDRDPNGTKFYFKRDRQGIFRQTRFNKETNRWRFVHEGIGVFFGKRMAYYDYSF